MYAQVLSHSVSLMADAYIGFVAVDVIYPVVPLLVSHAFFTVNLSYVKTLLD